MDESRSQTIGDKFVKESLSLIHEFSNYVQENKFNSNSNNELLELMIILDVNRIIHRVFKNSDKKYRETNKVIRKLKNDKIIIDGINEIISKRKFKNISTTKSFNRMRMYCHLLYKYDGLIVLYKYLGDLKRKIKNG